MKAVLRWLCSAAGRLGVVVLALLLGLLPPAYADPLPPAPVVVVDPTPPDEQPPLVVQVFLLAYRAHGPPAGGVVIGAVCTSQNAAGFFVALDDGSGPRGIVVYGSYIDETLAVSRTARGKSTRWLWVTNDRRYSPVAVTDAAGVVVERFEYDAYGEQTRLAGEGKAPFKIGVGYTGRTVDSTGLMYFRARMYAPGLGRFVNRDPAGYVDGLGLYGAYFVPGGMDPSGLGNESNPFESGVGYVNSYLQAFANAMSSFIFGTHPVNSNGNANGIIGGGGMVGGVLREGSFRIYSLPSQDDMGRFGSEFGASQVLIINPLNELAWGETTTGLDASRLWAGGRLAFDLAPFAAEARMGMLEARLRSAVWTDFLQEAARRNAASLRALRDKCGDEVIGAVGLAAKKGGSPTIARITPGSLPSAEEAAVRNTMMYIDSGGMPTGDLAKKWGTTFKNWSGDLPGAQGAGSPYREYRVTPPAGTTGAGTNRIVVNAQTGEVYYTWTHYGDTAQPAFVQIR